MKMTELLIFVVKHKASDLHFSAGSPVMVRENGELRCINDRILTHQQISALIDGVMNDKQRQAYQKSLTTRFCFELAGVSRFRISIFKHQHGIAAVFKVIPFEIPSLEDIQAPEIFKELCKASSGLILVTGASGSGKSTTLAAMLNYINANRWMHIATIEDPIEFVHHSEKSLINQHQFNQETENFNTVLETTSRLANADVIFVGDIKNSETIRLALMAAEAGHLVFGNLHTDVLRTLDYLMNSFPEDEQEMIRYYLSQHLQGIISQTLLNKVGGGQIAGYEILIGTPNVRGVIFENGGRSLIYSMMKSGIARGMQTLDRHLSTLVDKGLITREIARMKAISKAAFK